jgi:hypothetical protein
VQTSRHEDPQEVDNQVEGELLVARLEEVELMSSSPAGVEEVWTTFSRGSSISKVQMVIVIPGLISVNPDKGPSDDR